MKIIKGQKITSVAATSEDTNYPKENVLDEHPKKLWKAASGVTTATLTFEIDTNSGAMAMFNTNAISAVVTVSSPNNLVWHASDIGWDSGDIVWPIQDSGLTDAHYDLDGESGALWVEWVRSPTPVTATVVLTTTSTETLQAGVATACCMFTVACPQRGIVESMKSYDITRELQNGAFYRKARDRVRTFTFEFIEDRNPTFYEFMYTIAREVGYRPMAWQLADMDGFWWVVYARFDGKLPAGKHSMPDYTRINTRLIEVL